MGKVYTQIDIVKTNIENIQKALLNGNHNEAIKQWKLAKSAFEVYETAKSKMSGKTALFRKRKTKLEDMKKFEKSFNEFKENFGTDLDDLAQRVKDAGKSVKATKQLEDVCEQFADDMTTLSNQAVVATKQYASVFKALQPLQQMASNLSSNGANESQTRKLETALAGVQKDLVRLEKERTERARSVDAVDRRLKQLPKVNGDEHAENYLKIYKRKREEYARQVNEQNDATLKVATGLSEASSAVEQYKERSVRLTELCQTLQEIAIRASKDIEAEFDILKEAANDLSELQKEVVRTTITDKNAARIYESFANRVATFKKDAIEGNDGIEDAWKALESERAEYLKELQGFGVKGVNSNRDASSAMKEYGKMVQKCEELQRAGRKLFETAEQRWTSIEQRVEEDSMALN